MLPFDVLEAGEPRQKLPCVALVLIVDKPLDRDKDDRPRVAGKVARGCVQKIAHRARRGARAMADRCGRGNGRAARLRRLESRAEGGEAALDPDLAAADRRLERHAREGKRSGARERAEQHRAEHAAGRVRQRLHVEREEFARGLAAGGEQRWRIDAAVGERNLLGHGEDAMGGSDEQRPLRRDEAALHRARGFHQLGGEHDVDVARHRHQRQHRRAARRLRGRFRKQFDVIDGGAGALRDARHGGRLGEIPAVLGKIDDPVGKHAAALAAERNHCNGDRPHRGWYVNLATPTPSPSPQGGGEHTECAARLGFNPEIPVKPRRGGRPCAVATSRSRRRVPYSSADPTASGWRLSKRGRTTGKAPPRAQPRRTIRSRRRN